MSSWFGGLNDSFTQLSEKAGQLGGQISTFTKEVLAEEDSDNEERVGPSQINLSQMEIQSEASVVEVDLKSENMQLKSQIHKLELEANNSAVEYEARQQQKQKEINQLKLRLQQYEGGVHGVAMPTTAHGGDAGDHIDDFGDVITAQGEINRLSNDLEASKIEAEKWKQIANEIKNAQIEDTSVSTDGNRVKELEEELKREIQHHVQEVQSIQHVQDATLQKYQEEIRKLKQQVKNGTSPEEVHSTEVHELESEMSKLRAENDELKDKLRTKNRQLLMQKKRIETAAAAIEKSKQETENVKDEYEKLKIEHEKITTQQQNNTPDTSSEIQEILNLLSNHQFVEQHQSEEAVDIIKKKVTSLIENIETLTSQQIQHVEEIRRLNEQLDDRRQAVQDEDENRQLAESDQHDQDFNCVPEEDRNPHRSMEAESDQYHQAIRIGAPMNQSSPHRNNHSQQQRAATSFQDMSQNPGDLTLTLQALRKQVEDYEIEISQFDSIQLEWQQEKLSLQSLLEQYQDELSSSNNQFSGDVPEDERAASIGKLKQELKDLQESKNKLEEDNAKMVVEKDRLVTAAQNLEEELNASIADNEIDSVKNNLSAAEIEKKTLQEALDALTNEINKSRFDKEETTKALEELDTQHQQEIKQMLEIRDELSNEVKTLQQKLEEEMADKNHILSGIEKLKQHLAQKMDETDESNQALHEEVEELRMELESAKSQNEELQSMIMNTSNSQSEEFKTRIKEVENELNDSLQKESKLQDDIQRLRDEIEENHKENEQLIHELKAQEEKCLAQEELIRELKSTPNEASVKLVEELKASHSQEIYELKQEHDTLLNENSQHTQNLEVRFGALERDKKNVAEQLVEANSRIEMLQSTNEKLQQEIKSTQEVARKKEEENLQKNSNQEEVARLQEELLRLENELQEMGTEMENSGKEMAQMQNLNLQEIEKLKSLHLDEVGNMRSKHGEEVAGLKAEKGELKDIFECEKRLIKQEEEKNVEENNEKHAVEMENLKIKYEKMISDMKQDMEASSDVEIQQKITSIRDECRTQIEQLEKNYLDEKAKLESKISTFENESQILLDEKLKERAEKNDIESKHAAELKNLLEDVYNMKATIADLEQKKVDLESNLNLVVEEKEALSIKVSELKNNVGTLENNLKKSENNLELLNKKYEEQETSYQNIIQQIKEENQEVVKNLQVQIQSLDSSHKELQDKINVTNETMKQSMANSEHQLHEEVANLSNQLNEKDEMLNSLKTEFDKKEGALLTRLQEETLRLEEDIETLGDELEKSGKELKELETSYESKISHIKAEKDAEIRKMEDELNANVMQNVAYEKEVAALCEEKNDILKQFSELKSKYKSETALYKTDREQSKINSDNLQVVEATWSEKFSNLETENKALNEQINLLKQQYDTQVKEVEIKHTEREKELSDNVQCLNKAADDYVATIDKLKQAHSIELNLLQSSLSDITNQKSQFQTDNAKLKSDVANLQEKLSGLQHEVSTLKQQMKQTKTKEANVVENSLQKQRENGDMDADHLKNELNKCRVHYEEKIKKLSSELTEMKKMSSKYELGKSDVDKMLKEMKMRDISGLGKTDLSKDDIGSLLSLIRERDEVINILYQQNTPGKEVGNNQSQLQQLESEKNTLLSEKEQILAVVSEKTRENRKLKEEIHKMMDVIAAGETALSKMQSENQELVSRFEGYDPDMTKEAVTKLSRLVREKELEIESLQQKCNTLLEVLQQTPQSTSDAFAHPSDNLVSGQQVQALLQEKEQLENTLKTITQERDSLKALTAQKHLEFDELRNAAQSAVDNLEKDADDNSKLQINFGNMVHDYEQLQMKIASMQKESYVFKNTVTNLLETKDSLLKKLEYYEQNSVNNAPPPNVVTETNQQSSIFNAEDFKILQERLEHKSESLHQKDILLKEVTEASQEKEKEVSHLLNDIREKDLLIHGQLTEIQRVKKDLSTRTNEISILRKSVENLREQVNAQTNTANECKEEVKNVVSKLEEKESESQAFQETNSQLSMLLKDKEYELEMLRDKCTRLESTVSEQRQGKETEAQKLSDELEMAQQQLLVVQHERDQLMVSLKQRQLESNKYSTEAQDLREKSIKLESELARLRNHLLQVEESNTQETMLYEEREQDLKQQLEKFRSSQSAANEATEQSMQQIESLQEQLRVSLQQRDQANQQYQLSQEQSSQYASALQTLQSAVAQMQREEAATYQARTNQLMKKLEDSESETDAMRKEVAKLKEKLAETSEILESAARLNEQLELKETSIDQLKSIVSEKQLQVEELLDKIHTITEKHENMVDKEILKNLFLGYFATSKRDDVLHLITSVLGFTDDELKKIHDGRGWMAGWIPSWRGSGEKSRSLPVSPRDGQQNVNESFSQMFVKFLETESSPHDVARLPAQRMINEEQQKMSQRKMASASSALSSSVPTPVDNSFPPRSIPSLAGRYNQFHTTNTSTPDKQKSHPLIMQPLTPILPTFGAMQNKKSMEKEILQDVLHANSNSVKVTAPR